MQVGLHLPQFGRAAAPGAVQRIAAAAEALGYDDVWASDHLVVPAEQRYPPPYLYDPLQTLAFAAASTRQIKIGTSVLVLPQYASPLALANTLASLDNLSDGRLILGVGIGWSQGEYEALNAPFSDRGARLDDIIGLFRAAWSDDPINYDGRFYKVNDIRLLPKPAHRIPIWIGGSSERALARAAALGDGYHGINVKASDARRLVDSLRERRPEPEFTISMRLTVPPTRTGAEVATDLAAYADAGVQHCVLVPESGDDSTWLECATQWAAGLEP